METAAWATSAERTSIRYAIVRALSGRTTPKSLKMVVDAALLSVEHYGNKTRRLSYETLNRAPLYRCFTLDSLKN